MKNKLFFIFLIGFAHLGLAQTTEHNPFVIKELATFYFLKDQTSFLADSLGNLDLLAIQKPENQARFLPFSKIGDLSRCQAYWLKLSIRNELPKDHEFMLLSGLARKAFFYEPKPDSSGYNRYPIGGAENYSTLKDYIGFGKTLSNRNMISIPTHTTQTFYIQIVRYQKDFQTRDITIPLRLSPLSKWDKLTFDRYNRAAGYIGAFLIMLAYSLIYFALSRDKAYLYYTFYVLTVLMPIIIVSYYLFDTEKYAGVLFFLFLGLFSIFYFLFMQTLLQTYKLIPKWHKRLSLWIKIKASIVVFYSAYLLIFDDFIVAEILFIPTILIELVFVIIIFVALFRTRDKIAILFMSSTIMAWIGITLASIINDREGFIYGADNGLTVWGFIAEMLLFAMTLGYKARQNEKDKITAQAKLIEQLRENELLQTKVNRELEEKVKERTLQLVEKNEEIQQQNEELASLADNLQQQNEEIEKQAHEIRKYNTDLTASITYAKRIQSAILPLANRFQEVFGQENYFLFFRPRDIVSGDFYWLASKNDYVIISVADCTGHGVPGAFMSMIGDSLLNQIVYDQEIQEVSQILQKLNQQIRRSLKQDETDSRDGMDIVIVMIDFAQKIATYAGAMNPLYYAQEPDNQLIEIKATKKPIGGHNYRSDLSFAQHTISLTSPTTFYLCTDGFQDQFGGKEKKKYMIGNFKKLLQKISPMPLHQQNQYLAQNMDEWIAAGNEKQVDDITIVGIRIAM